MKILTQSQWLADTFNGTQVPVTVENGKVKLRIEYTTDLIDSLGQK